MTKTKRWITVIASAAIVGSLMGGAALADKSPKTPVSKESKKPAPSAGAMELQKQLEGLYNEHMEQFRTEAGALIDQAVKEGKVSEKEAANYRHKFAKTQVKQKPVEPAKKKSAEPAAPLSRAELQATLEKMVKEGKITQEHADKKLAGFDAAQANKK